MAQEYSDDAIHIIAEADELPPEIALKDTIETAERLGVRTFIDWVCIAEFGHNEPLRLTDELDIKTFIDRASYFIAAARLGSMRQ